MAQPITAWISVKIGCPGCGVSMGCGGGYFVSHPLVGWGAGSFRGGTRLSGYPASGISHLCLLFWRNYLSVFVPIATSL